MFIHVTRESVLIKDVRNIVDTYKDDGPEKCVTGKLFLYWPGMSEKNWNKLKTAVKTDSSGED